MGVVVAQREYNPPRGMGQPGYVICSAHGRLHNAPGTPSTSEPLEAEDTSACAGKVKSIFSSCNISSSSVPVRRFLEARDWQRVHEILVLSMAPLLSPKLIYAICCLDCSHK